MPGGDGTGPAGMGPMTGRAAGYCAGYPVPGFMNPIPGRGFGGWGRGRGGGWGRRNWFYATGLTGWQRAGLGYPPFFGAGFAAPTREQQLEAMKGQAGYFGAGFAAPTREQELEALKGQAEYFEDALAGVKKRIEELESQSPSE